MIYLLINHLTTERLYFIVDILFYPEHQYGPHQSRSNKREEKKLAELYYWYHKGSFHPIYVNITVVN
jgi:hypothetical protein